MMELQSRRQDGTFVTTFNGYPYHVTTDDPMYDAALAEAAILGDGLPFDEPPAAAPVTLDDYRRAIQAHVDASANERGYDSGSSCASYFRSTNSRWAGEATAFIAWRDAVWAFAYTELVKVEDGQRERPSVAGILAELPSLAWPH
ncbi:hypothetical protein ACWIGM_05330 [Bosea sp. NPDC055332]